MTKPASAPPADVVLLNCRRKIEAYQEAYGLAYVGGQEASSLLRDIDKAIAASAQAREVEPVPVVSNVVEATAFVSNETPIHETQAEPAPVAQGDDMLRIVNNYAQALANARAGKCMPGEVDHYFTVMQATIADHARIVAGMQQTIDTAIDVLDHSAERIEALEASLAACRADAERWQWLRAQHASYGRSWHIREPSNTVAPIDIDAAIDALKEPGNG